MAIHRCISGCVAALLGRRLVRLRFSIAICVWIASLTLLAASEEEPASEPDSLTVVAANRLKIPESEVIRRAEELKRFHIENFDKHLQVHDEFIANLARRLANHERRAAAVARGVAASGDKDLADTKSRMEHDAKQIRAITGCIKEFGSRSIALHEMIANSVGALRVRPSDGSAKADGSPRRPLVDVDAKGIEESISQLDKGRWDLEGKSRSLDERLQSLKERLRAPQSEFNRDGSQESKVLAKLLTEQVLRDIELTEQGFDNALSVYAEGTAGDIGPIQRDLRQASKSIREWRRPKGEPPLPNDVIQELAVDFANAKEVEAKRARDAALEAIEHEIRERSRQLNAADRVVETAEALELQAVVVLLMRDSRDGIVAALKARPESPTTDGGKPTIDLSKASLTERVAITIPRIQEISQVIRRCREVWLR